MGLFGKKALDSAVRASALHVNSSRAPSELLQSCNKLLFSAQTDSLALPDLPYDYNALEPAISTETMTIHHTKHHQTYVNNLKANLDSLDAAVTNADVSTMIALQPAIKFNGGGHLNHSLFWANLAAPGSTSIQASLETALTNSFRSVDAFKSELSSKTIAVQGSGWGWLGYNPQMQRLQVATCANQDPLQATTGLVPLLGIDCWEHAYYVDYRNLRPKYVEAIWDVIDWNVVAQRLEQAQE